MFKVLKLGIFIAKYVKLNKRNMGNKNVIERLRYDGKKKEKEKKDKITN